MPLCARSLGSSFAPSHLCYRTVTAARCQTQATGYRQGSRPKLVCASQARCLSQSSKRLSVKEDPVRDDTDQVDSDILLQMQEKPQGYMAAKPVDDVYMLRHYPKQLISFHEAMDMLRKQHTWAYCRKPEKYSDRTVTIGIKLDMTLKKKKKVVPFQNMIILPHPFKEDNKVLCFAEGTDVQVAKDAGAFMVGGEEVVEDLLAHRTHIRAFDFCVATPDMMSSLSKLKEKLRKRFPNSKRGSVSNNIPAMLNLYRRGQEYKVQAKSSTINCAIGKLSLTNDQLEENMAAIISDVCSHKPLEYGPFITQLIVTAFLLDGHMIDVQKYLPVPDEDQELRKELDRLDEEN
ncbi:large ribosomal subunit protein uL1m-like [Diadema antillarum]|uniref:large ribosomal subunit protein uL1m-like n=1 Tax=Diadema antillarum TaxID=105358 RepID=UPI003A87A4DE